LGSFLNTAPDTGSQNIALHCAQGNLGVKKVFAPSEIPSKLPIMCFARIKKIISRTIRNSGALIVKKFSFPDPGCLPRIPDTHTFHKMENIKIF
jgi:hypothetical protein